MQPKVFVSQNKEERDNKIWEALQNFQITKNNPDLLILDEEKIGITQVKQLIKHLSTKPFGSTPKSAVILNASDISLDAQNALLKTLEETPGKAIILIGVDSENRLLPTVLSRCLVVSLKLSAIGKQPNFELKKILSASIEERFELVEKTENKEELLEDFIESYRKAISENEANPEFLEELLQAQIWKETNVNIRTILEYLMLKLESK